MFGIDDLLYGGLASTAGGLLSSLGDKLGESLGLTPDVRSSRSMQGANILMDNITNKIMKTTPAYMRNTASSSAGLLGPAAQSVAQQKFGNVGASVSDINTANRLKNLGSQAISNVGNMYNSSKMLAQQQTGQSQKNALNMVRQSGGPIAALGRTSSLIGQGAGASALNLFANAGNQYNQALNTAGKMNESASNTIFNSRRASLNEAMPYAVQYQNPSALIGGITSGANIGASAGATQARTNPLAGLAGMLGSVGGNYVGNWAKGLEGKSPNMWGNDVYGKKDSGNQDYGTG